MEKKKLAREFIWALVAAGAVELVRFAVPLLVVRLLVVIRFLVVR